MSEAPSVLPSEAKEEEAAAAESGWDKLASLNVGGSDPLVFRLLNVLARRIDTLYLDENPVSYVLAIRLDFPPTAAAGGAYTSDKIVDNRIRARRHELESELNGYVYAQRVEQQSVPRPPTRCKYIRLSFERVRMRSESPLTTVFVYTTTSAYYADILSSCVRSIIALVNRRWAREASDGGAIRPQIVDYQFIAATSLFGAITSTIDIPRSPPPPPPPPSPPPHPLLPPEEAVPAPGAAEEAGVSNEGWEEDVCVLP